MKSLIKKVITILPDKLALQIPYYYHHRCFINWKHPRSFSEKLQWLKVYDRNPMYTDLVDKIKVKPIVAGKIGSEFVIPTLKIWDSAADICFDELPNQFVLKTNHAGGSSGVIVCSDKAKLNKDICIKALEQSLSSDTYYYGREWPYKNIQRKVFAEVFLSDEKNEDLTDYKFFCFNGEPKFCQVIRDRHKKETIDFYDMDWNHMPFVGLNPVARNGLTSVARHGLTPVARPGNLVEMKDICRKLAKDIPFVRVDLYVIDDKKYFGELTFYPASGLGVFTPEEWNNRLGGLLTLSNAMEGVNI